jgi:hypothetical protein
LLPVLLDVTEFSLTLVGLQEINGDGTTLKGLYMNAFAFPLAVFLVVPTLVFTPPAQALSLNFDDLDASAGNIDLTVSNYQGYSWSNFFAYDAANQYFGFPNGVVSGTNAAYSGGELIDGSTVLPVVGSISSTGLFDVGTAYLAAGYYDGLDVTIEGVLNGSVLFSKTVTVSSTAAQLFAFNFTGINQLDFTDQIRRQPKTLVPIAFPVDDWWNVVRDLRQRESCGRRAPRATSKTQHHPICRTAVPYNRNDGRRRRRFACRYPKISNTRQRRRLQRLNQLPSRISRLGMAIGVTDQLRLILLSSRTL